METMSSSIDPTFVKLVLVGDPRVGKSNLCRALSPGFAPCDGYAVYHSNNLIETVIHDIRTPPAMSSNNSPIELPPISRNITLYTMILQPRQEGDHTKLTPFVMMGADVVGLCYSIANPQSLDFAVQKWLPFIKYYLPFTPIVLVGYQPEPPTLNSISRTPDEIRHKGAVSPHHIRDAESQTDAVYSVQWSGDDVDKGALRGPPDVAQALAWYGYHYARNSGRKSKTNHRLVM